MMYRCTLVILTPLPWMVSNGLRETAFSWMLINNNWHFVDGGFLKWGQLPPVIIHFHRIFHEITHHFGGTTMAMETPICLLLNSCGTAVAHRLERRKYLNRGVTQPEPFVFNTPTRSQSRQPSMPKAHEFGCWKKIGRDNPLVNIQKSY